MIYYFTPFDTKKRLGYIHNQYCKLVPNPDDYICILDPDTMFLHPHQQSWIEEILRNMGNDFDLFGCYTNRVGVKQQVALPENFNDFSLEKHCELATRFYSHYHNIIKETNLIAGFFMLFKRSLWDKIKFEQGIDFDIKFCNAVKKSGGRIGIMQGIYIFHQYRILADNPTKYKKHLL